MTALASALSSDRASGRFAATTVWALLVAVLGLAGALLAQNPRWALDVALVAVGIGLFAWQPFAVLLVLVVVGPKASPRLHPFIDIIIVLAGGVVLLLRGRPVPGRIVWIPWIVLAGYALWRVPLHPTPDQGTVMAWLELPFLGWHYLPTLSGALIQWWAFASLVVIFMLAAWLVGDVRRLRFVVAAILLSAVYPVLLGLQQLASGTYAVRSGFDAVEGPFKFPNDFGFFLATVLLLGVVTYFEVRSRRVRIALAMLLAGSSLCLVFTYTRGAWVGFAMGFLLLGVLWRRRLIAVGVVAIVLASFAFPSQTNKVQQRFGDLAGATAVTKNSVNWRKGEWRAMYHRFGFDMPYTGHGFDTYAALTVVQFGTQGHVYNTVSPVRVPGRLPGLGFTAHNDYLRLLIELGVAGVLLWIGILLALAGSALHAAFVPAVRPYAVASATIVVALGVMSSSDNLIAYNDSYAIAAALTGAVVGASTRLRRPAR